MSSNTSFAIILTTYKRPSLVLRSIHSVLAQTVLNWQLIIINDSPEEDYSEAKKLIASHSNIIYIQNKKNYGKNFSVNKAFGYLQQMSFEGYVVFLDDDDWLDSRCLETFTKTIAIHQDSLWFVSNRSIGEKVLTQNKTNHELISYYIDVLITKRFKGDATHCIEFKKTQSCRFSEKVKNGEEWFYFSQVALQIPTFRYIATNGTLSEGYLSGGLTALRISTKEKLILFLKLLNELLSKRLLNPCTAIYMFLRFGKIFL